MRGRTVLACVFVLGALTACQVTVNVGSGDRSPTPTPLVAAGAPTASQAGSQPAHPPTPSPRPISTMRPTATPRPPATPTPVPEPTAIPSPTPAPPPPTPTPAPPAPPPTPTPGFVTGYSAVADGIGDATDYLGTETPPVDLPVDLTRVTLESDGERLKITFEAATPISQALPPGVELLYNVWFGIEGGWWLVIKGTSDTWEIWASDGIQMIDVPNVFGDWSGGRFVVWVPWAWVPFVAPDQFEWSVRADWDEGEWHWIDMTDTARFPS